MTINNQTLARLYNALRHPIARTKEEVVLVRQYETDQLAIPERHKHPLRECYYQRTRRRENMGIKED